MYSNLIESLVRRLPFLARQEAPADVVSSSELCGCGWPGDLTEETASLAEDATLVSGPSWDDPRTCEHALTVTLNPAIVPDWLRAATADVRVSLPEVPGLPQAFRVDGYVDWLRLLATHRKHFQGLDHETPTMRSLAIVEELRSRGHNAEITAQIYILRRTDASVLVFGLEAGAIVLCGTSDHHPLAPYVDELDDRSRTPLSGPGMIPVLYPDDTNPSIEFC